MRQGINTRRLISPAGSRSAENCLARHCAMVIDLFVSQLQHGGGGGGGGGGAGGGGDGGGGGGEQKWERQSE